MNSLSVAFLALLCCSMAMAGYSRYYRTGYKTHLGGAGYGYGYGHGYRPLRYAKPVVASYHSKPVVAYHSKPVVTAYHSKPVVTAYHSKPVVTAYHHAPSVVYAHKHADKPHATHYVKPAAYYHPEPHGVVYSKPAHYLGGHTYYKPAHSHGYVHQPSVVYAHKPYHH